MKTKETQPADPTVATWLRRFARAYTRKDLDALLALIDLEGPILILGSGPDERCFSGEQLRKHVARDFAQVDNISMKYDWIKTDAQGGVAWFACEATLTVTVGRQKTAYPYRFTGVLVKRDKHWRLRMSQMGLLSASQEAGQSWPCSQ